MSAPSFGLPSRSTMRPQGVRKVFTHIPRLHELMPRAGWPGVVYAQVCVHNMQLASERTAEPAGLSPIIFGFGTLFYTIQGPKGEVGMALMGSGERIVGAAPEAGARLFFTDGEVERETGLKVEFPIWFRAIEVDTNAEVPSAPRADRAGEGSRGPEGVQLRPPAQRKSQRPQGDQQETGGGNRIE